MSESGNEGSMIKGLPPSGLAGLRELARHAPKLDPIEIKNHLKDLIRYGELLFDRTTRMPLAASLRAVGLDLNRPSMMPAIRSAADLPERIARLVDKLTVQAADRLQMHLKSGGVLIARPESLRLYGEPSDAPMSAYALQAVADELGWSQAQVLQATEDLARELGVSAPGTRQALVDPVSGPSPQDDPWLNMSSDMAPRRAAH